jgi:hypothetical protein
VLARRGSDQRKQQ